MTGLELGDRGPLKSTNQNVPQKSGLAQRTGPWGGDKQLNNHQDKTQKTQKTRGIKIMENLQSALRIRVESLLDAGAGRQRKAASVLGLVDSFARIRRDEDLGSLLDDAARMVVELGGVTGAAISVIEEFDSERLMLYRCLNLEPAEPDDLIFDADSPLVAATREADGPFPVTDLVGKTGPRSKKRLILRRLGCEMLVPLKRGERVLGLLLLGKRTDGQAFTADDIDQFAAYAALLSMAVENVLLYEQHQNSIK